MFDFFKNAASKGGSSTNPDVKEIRDAILRLLKERIQELDGGEGKYIDTLQLYVYPTAEERYKYEAALYTADPRQFKDEVQRIADNFDLDLPADWKLDVLFVEERPEGAKVAPEINAALLLINKSLLVQEQEVVASAAQITILHGSAEKEHYILQPGTSRINIGRESQIQSADGSIRLNAIAFAADAHESNKYISRQHAHIEWDKKSATFMLYADEGGVPPGNKTKIRIATDESIHKLNSTQVGYLLKAGDQVILGESAVIDFQWISNITS